MFYFVSPEKKKKKCSTSMLHGSTSCKKLREGEKCNCRGSAFVFKTLCDWICENDWSVTIKWYIFYIHLSTELKC